MLAVDFDSLGKISDRSGLQLAEFDDYKNQISGFLDKIHSRNQGFYEVIDQDFAANYRASGLDFGFKNIVILGIGGSALGSICLNEVLAPLFGMSEKKLFVLDNIDPDLIAEFAQSVELSECLFLVVTKSGETPETLAQFFYFHDLLVKRGLSVSRQMIFVTDPRKGFLRKLAQNLNVKTFEIPENVGGRFSVLTDCGLLPAFLMGFDVESLLLGAREMRQKFLSEDFEINLPFKLALTQFLLYRKGKKINVLMSYSQKLFRFADWYRQLLAESIGKKLNLRGEQVFAGITPVNALGVTDQHSQSQLYNEGPNDKVFMFLYVEKHQNQPVIPAFSESGAFDYLENVSFQGLLDIERKATMEALNANDRANISIRIDEISAFNLGQLFMLFEASIAFLGELLDINAYDQPGVELSKNLTREQLKKRKIK
jgi:glucose-6-phosphate isomerase